MRWEKGFNEGKCEYFKIDIMWAGLVIAITPFAQYDWTGGFLRTCSIGDSTCYNSCPVVYSFDNTFCLADENLNYKNSAGVLGIKGSFQNLEEHVIKGPGEAGGWDNDPDVVDIDGDGDLDLVVSDESFFPDDYDSVWVFYNDGYGNFTQVNLGTVASADELAEVDIDKDGDLDIVVTGAAYDYGEDLVLFVQTSSGWRKCVICEDVAGDCRNSAGNEREAEGVYAGDLDGDGDIDIVVSHLEEGSLYWFEKVPPGTAGATGCRVGTTPYYFLKHPIYPNVQGDEGWNVWIQDMDNDGDADIITTLGSLVAIYWNDGTADFSYADTLLEPEVRGSTDPIRNFYGLAIADFDKDGLMDVAVSKSDLDTVKIYRNLGERQFAPVYAEYVPYPMGLAAADVDNDGDMDLYVASYTDGTTTEDSTIYAIVNEGGGLFVLHTTDIPRRSYFGTGAGDLNGDFNSDLLVRAGTMGEDDPYREGLYWYAVNLAYPDSAVIISNKLDATGPTNDGSFALDSIVVVGKKLANVDLYIRYARNETDLNNQNWALTSTSSILTCSLNTDETRFACTLPESTMVEFIQYKLVLHSINSDTDPYGDETPYVDSVIFVFDENVTPVYQPEYGLTGRLTMEVYDIRGRLIMRKSVEDTRAVPPQLIRPGIYLIILRDRRGLVERKKILLR